MDFGRDKWYCGPEHLQVCDTVCCIMELKDCEHLRIVDGSLWDGATTWDYDSELFLPVTHSRSSDLFRVLEVIACDKVGSRFSI